MYSYKLSTEENYYVPYFVGKYKDIRPLLDLSYHRLYHATRCKVQDDIVDHFLGQAESDEIMPWVIFTAGAMGAGKGHCMRWMDKHGYIPLKSFVTVDPDAIRQALPEWEGYVQRNPSTAGELTQKEAGLIAEILGYAALRGRRNVIFDGSLRDRDWYLSFFAKLRHEFPGVRIAVIHIMANREEVLARALARGHETGRHVPVELLEMSMQVSRGIQSSALTGESLATIDLDGDGEVSSSEVAHARQMAMYHGCKVYQ